MSGLLAYVANKVIVNKVTIAFMSTLFCIT